MVVMTSIYVAEMNLPELLPMEEVEEVKTEDPERAARELMSWYEGKSRVLRIDWNV